jgi:hypothetical protein
MGARIGQLLIDLSCLLISSQARLKIMREWLQKARVTPFYIQAVEYKLHFLCAFDCAPEALSIWMRYCVCARAAAGKYIGAHTHSFWVIVESFPWPAPINPLQYGLFPYHAHQNILTHRERDLRKRNEKVSAAPKERWVSPIIERWDFSLH